MMKNIDNKGKNTASGDVLDYQWHLAQTPEEVVVTELEFALMRTYEGFARWQTEYLAAASSHLCTGSENAMLHLIRMNERPKSIKELARLTNRDDIPNIQYSLRKLVAAGLVQRQGSNRTGVLYEVTEQGRQATDASGEVRRRLLMHAVSSVPGLQQRMDDARRTLNLLTGIYEEIARTAATHRGAT